MNPLSSLSYQDLVALALAAGVKIGGGNWTKTAIWGFGARFLMGYLGFPSNQCLPSQAQSQVGTAAGIFSRLFGGMAVGVGTVNQPGVVGGQSAGVTPAQGAPGTPGGPPIDVPYQQVPTGN